MAIAMIVAAGCAEPQASAPPSGLTATPSAPVVDPGSSQATRTSSAAAAPEHRIGVRAVDGEGELFDRLTGEQFVPRGMNLIRLAAGRHSTLDVDRYDPVGGRRRARADG
jgi:hypothetical protein